MRAITPSLRILTLALIASTANGLDITGGHSANVNDRFSSGFPLAPTENINGSYIGLGLDWSGISWSTTTFSGSVGYKGFAMLSPKHFLTAQHYEYTPLDGDGTVNQRTLGIRILGHDDVTYTTNGVDSVDNLGYGIELTANNGVTNKDLAIGTLNNIVTAPSNMSRIAVLDLNNTSSSTNFSNYSLGGVILHGRANTTNDSPRIENTAINNLFFNGDLTQPVIETNQADAAFKVGDSGHPALRIWTNPNNSNELTVLGVNSTRVPGQFNYVSFLPVAEAISAAQNVVNTDGHALRCVGNPTATWSGSDNRPHRNNAWSPSGSTSDEYVTFDPATASNFSVNVSSNHNLRGLYFKSNGSNSAFSFSGSQTLSMGRGGITNYDDDQQTFSADISLTSSQFWDAGPGGISIADLDTNGNLLEIQTEGDSIISGNINDSGGIALTSGTLTLSGNSSYTGKTWAHEGNLIVNGDIDSSASLTIGETGMLSGTGSTPTLEGAGTVSPGASPGILTAESIDPSGGMDFDFEFTGSLPTFNNASASVNDLVRITDVTPFIGALDSSNVIRIFLNAGAPSNGQTYTGAFFTDAAADFISSVSNATFEIYVVDGAGSVSFDGLNYSLYEGPLLFTLTTEAQIADFGSGNVAGRIMQITVEPDLTQYEGWKIFYSLTGNAALATADDDNDGIALLLEFVLGGNPNANDRSILPTVALTEDSGSTYLELSLTRPIGLQDINYLPQTTTDLASWPVDSTGIDNPSPTGTPNLDGTETVIYRRAQPISGSDQAFIRVNVSEN